MFWVKRWVKDFFALSHSQANGFIVLVPLLAIIIFSEPVWHWYLSRQSIDFSNDWAKLDSLILLWDHQTEKNTRENTRPGTTENSPHHLFSFDPNSATIEELQTLGFSLPLATRIGRYRQKGGKFRVKGDLLKIYGVDSAFYKQLYMFIDLPEKVIFEKREHQRKYPYEKERERKLFAKFDLNKADTLQLMKINGIGGKRSLRIIKFRDALGGFISPEQLKEVYGLDSAVVNRLIKSSFIAADFEPDKININTSDENTLATHPYLTKAVARAIVAYRFQHGEFLGLDDLRKIHALDDESIQKIAPYLTVGD